VADREGTKKLGATLPHVIKEGTGEDIPDTATVVLNYTGRTLTGATFDSTEQRGPTRVDLSQAIPGFRKAVTALKVGGKATAFIPAEDAYGDTGLGPIEPGAGIIFDIEVTRIVKDEEHLLPASSAPAPTEANAADRSIVPTTQ
jgi:FKBP-type peptidyl-prolyl cis-trans isomerase